MTRLHLLVMSLAAMFAYVSPNAQGQSKVPKADTESWNGFQLQIPMNKKADFLIQGTVRIGGNLTTPVDERWGFGFNYKIQKYVTLNELYFHREAKPPNGKHESEDRISFGATSSVSISRWRFTACARTTASRALGTSTSSAPGGALECERLWAPVDCADRCRAVLVDADHKKAKQYAKMCGKVEFR
jgi:hypothetical protein